MRAWRIIISFVSRVRPGALARNAFWRICKATERSFLYLYADALSCQTVFHVTFGGKAEVWLLPQCITAPIELVCLLFRVLYRTK